MKKFSWEAGVLIGMIATASVPIGLLGYLAWLHSPPAVILYLSALVFGTVVCLAVAWLFR